MNIQDLCGQFTIEVLVDSSPENPPEGLSLLERPKDLFRYHNDDKGSIRLFSECVYLLSCVKYQKVFNGSITDPIGPYVKKTDKSVVLYLLGRLNNYMDKKKDLPSFL